MILTQPPFLVCNILFCYEGEKQGMTARESKEHGKEGSLCSRREAIRKEASIYTAIKTVLREIQKKERIRVW